MLDFAKGTMGRQFFEGTMPKIAKNLERIANSLEKQNEELPVDTRWNKLWKALNTAEDNNQKTITIQEIKLLMQKIEFGEK